MTLLNTSTLLWTLSAPERAVYRGARFNFSWRAVVERASYLEIVIKVKKGLLEIPAPVSWWNRARNCLE